MAERTKIVCPRCDAVVATAPQDGLETMDLVCPHCGTRLRGPGMVEKAADAVKETGRDIARTIEKAVDRNKKS